MIEIISSLNHIHDTCFPILQNHMPCDITNIRTSCILVILIYNKNEIFLNHKSNYYRLIYLGVKVSPVNVYIIKTDRNHEDGLLILA